MAKVNPRAKTATTLNYGECLHKTAARAPIEAGSLATQRQPICPRLGGLGQGKTFYFVWEYCQQIFPLAANLKLRVEFRVVKRKFSCDVASN
jgi:hypothetical protein